MEPLSVSLTIARPREEVFSYLADVTNEAEWNPWAKWVRKISDGPINSTSREYAGNPG